MEVLYKRDHFWWIWMWVNVGRFKNLERFFLLRKGNGAKRRLQEPESYRSQV
jgi:hypothetical protein